MAKQRRGYMTVEVDLCEALEEITDADLLAEIEERKLSLGRDDFDPIDDLREAREELLRGRPAEALAILERLIVPKWRNKQACERDFTAAKAMLTTG